MSEDDGIDPLLVARPAGPPVCPVRWRFRGAWVQCGQLAEHAELGSDHVVWAKAGVVLSTRALRGHRRAWRCSECSRGPSRAQRKRTRLSDTCSATCAAARKGRLQRERRAAAR